MKKNSNRKNSKKAVKEKNPLVGHDVWLLTIVGEPGKRITTTSAHSSWLKVLAAARAEFKEQGLMDEWPRAKESLTEDWYFQDDALFHGDKFLIDCVKIY